MAYPSLKTIYLFIFVFLFITLNVIYKDWWFYFEGMFKKQLSMYKGVYTHHKSSLGSKIRERTVLSESSIYKRGRLEIRMKVNDGLSIPVKGISSSLSTYLINYMI